MFATASISASIKTNQFDVYNYIQTQFTIIKNLNAFTTYSIIPGKDLITISNIIMDCIEKLGDTSALYIRKINDVNISSITIDQLQKMQQTHDELIITIKKFNIISSDITYVYQNDYSQDAINHMHWDIINRYKMLIFEIIDLIKRLNVYVELVKNKIN